VAPGLGDDAAIDHEDAIGLAHGGQPVRDDQRGPALQQRPQCELSVVTLATCSHRREKLRNA
jgi:hypothetical protein